MFQKPLAAKILLGEIPF